MIFEGSVAFVNSPFQVARLRQFREDNCNREDLLIFAVRPRRKTEREQLAAALSQIHFSSIVWVRLRTAVGGASRQRKRELIPFLLKLTALLYLPESAGRGRVPAVFSGFKIQRLFLGYAWGRLARTLIQHLPVATETLLLDDGTATFRLLEGLKGQAPWPGGAAALNSLLRRRPRLITVFRDSLPDLPNNIRISKQEVRNSDVKIVPALSWIVGTCAPSSLTRGLEVPKSIWRYVRVVKQIAEREKALGNDVFYFPHRKESRFGLMLLLILGVKIKRINVSLEDYIDDSGNCPAEICGFPSTFFLMANLLLPSEVKLRVFRPTSWRDDVFRELQARLPSRVEFETI